MVTKKQMKSNLEMSDEEYVSFCYDALAQGICKDSEPDILCLGARRIPIRKALYFSWHPNDAPYRQGKIIFLDKNPQNLSYENLALKKLKHSKILQPTIEENQKVEESQQDIDNILRLVENLNIQTKDKLKQVDVIIENAYEHIKRWNEISTKKPELDDYDREYYSASIEALFNGRHLITKGRVFLRHKGRTFTRTRALWNLGHSDDPVLSTEVIHHKDGNKMNDACDNLEKMSAGEHMRLHVLQKQEMSKKKTAEKLISLSGSPAAKKQEVTVPKSLPICERDPLIIRHQVEIIDKKGEKKRRLLVKLQQRDVYKWHSGNQL